MATTVADIVKEMVKLGFFPSNKSGKTTVFHFSSMMGGVDTNNLTPAQTLELLIKIGFNDYEKIVTLLEEPLLKEVETLRNENVALKANFENAKHSLDAVQSEVQEGREAKAQYEGLKREILNLLGAPVEKPVMQISNEVPQKKKSQPQTSSNDEHGTNLIVFLSESEKEWYDGVTKKLKESKIGFSPLKTTYKRMHDVYSANIEGACMAFKLEYPLDLYGPTYCKYLTAIAHNKNLRDTFDVVFPSVLEEAIAKKAEKKAKTPIS